MRQRQGKCAQFLEGQTEGRIQLGAQMIAKGFYEKRTYQNKRAKMQNTDEQPTVGYVAAGDVYLDVSTTYSRVTL